MRWQDPQAFVDPSWDTEERDDVAYYLQRRMQAAACMGLSRCRFCDKINGSLEFSDGVYIWPEGLAHYLIEHDVRLPQAFVDHALKLRDELEDAQIDETWWLAQRTWSEETPK